MVVFLPGKIHTCLPADADRAQMDAKFCEDWEGGMVDCIIYGKPLRKGSLWSHLETQHDVYWLFTLNAAVAEPHAEGRRWVVWRKTEDEKLHCPRPGCPQAH